METPASSPTTRTGTRGLDPLWGLHKNGSTSQYGLFEEGLQQQTSVFSVLKGVEHHLLLFEGLHADETLDTLQKKVKDLLKSYTVPLVLHPIPAENRTLHTLYDAQRSRLFLIRPDGYIAHSGQATDLESFSIYLNRVFTHRGLINTQQMGLQP